MKIKNVCTVLATILLLIPICIVVVNGVDDHSYPGKYLDRYNEKHFNCNMSVSFETTENKQLTRVYNAGGTFTNASAYATLTVTPALDSSVAVEIQGTDGKYQVLSDDTDYYPNGTSLLKTPTARANTQNAAYLWYFGEQWIGNERLYLWDLHYYAGPAPTNIYLIGDTMFHYSVY